MDDYPICTEFPEKIWKTSEWFPQKIVNRKLKEMASNGKQLPNADTVRKVTDEIKQMIINNNGLSANRPLDFDSILERLEDV